MATRNPHAGEPFTDDDEVVAAALGDVSVPALLCTLVHLTGDPAWIRGPIQPRLAAAFDVQAGIAPDDQEQVRRAALPVIAAYRDAGCQPCDLSRELLKEMMEFLGHRPVEGNLAGLFFDDLQFEGGDTGAVTWADEVPAPVRDATPVVVIGCGMGGILAGIRLKQAGLPFVIVEKNPGPGGTWWENSYPGARVDIGSHQYCYSFEPGDHWSEFFCQQPELRDYFAFVVDKYGLRPHCRFSTAVTRMAWNEARSQWDVCVSSAEGVASAEGVEEVLGARFVISAVGSLNIPHLPAIPGMDSFSGPSFHSARWPEGLDIAAVSAPPSSGRARAASRSPPPSPPRSGS